ncbi:MAG: thioredoxin-disulfide reductase [Lachnospiraceae bacterium]|nr:thioredoxin-disulfide reductase [Lachnospiraceae bacterium]
MQKDVVIIGSGPAGLSAGIYAVRAGFDALIIERTGMGGGQVLNTYEVDNYPGMPGINGFDLGTKMYEHVKQLGVEVMACDVHGVECEEEWKVIHTSQGEIQTKTLVIATGATHAKLNVKGENEFGGKGVSYCATCDGAFFRNRKVAVVGGGDVAVEDAIFLAGMCEKVYLIHRRDELRAAKSLQEKLMARDNVEIVWNTVVNCIEGKDKVENLKLQNKNDGQIKDLAVSGVFVAVGMKPETEVFQGVVEMDAHGYIQADEYCETSQPGIVVAGDARTKRLRQIVTAVADGANAIYSLEKYLR